MSLQAGDKTALPLMRCFRKLTGWQADSGLPGHLAVWPDIFCGVLAAGNWIIEFMPVFASEFDIERTALYRFQIDVGS